MTKKQIAGIAAALVLGVALLMPSDRASAHDVLSGFSNPSVGGEVFYHFAHGFSPTRTAHEYVGFDPGGSNIGTTTTVSLTNANYQLRANDRCTNGATRTTGWVAVSGANFWVRGSGCSGAGFTLSQGQGGIRP
jgi:hypothetical protein